MKRLFVLAATLAFGLTASPTNASAQAAVGAHGGSLGVGINAAFGLAPKVNLRGTLGFIPSEPTIEAEDIDFLVEFPTLFLATADLYPVGFFHVSGGMLFVSRGGDVTGVGTFTGSQDIGGTVYSAADVGTLTGAFSLKSAMPYLGIGFGNPVGRSFGLKLDLGVGLGDVPTVDLGATGLLANDPTFITNLNEEELAIQADIPSAMRYYPVVSLAVTFGLGG